MSPLIDSDAYVFFRKIWSKKSLSVGDIIKVNHPTFGSIIKEIIFVDRNGLYWFTGENPNSVSTVEIGPVSADMICGKMAFVLNP